jgi:hypothetical protein
MYELEKLGITFKKGSVKGFKRTDDIDWTMVGPVRADGKPFPIQDNQSGEVLFQIALTRNLQSPGAVDNGDPNRLYPVFVKFSLDQDGSAVVHHVMISFDSGDLDYSNQDAI